MAEQKPSDAMDDVDRLFQCFKCGVTPPESALRERKRSKSKFKQGSGLLNAASSTCGTPSPGSAGCSTSNANKLRCGKQISPVVFYGSPNGVPPKRPISLLRLLREIRVDLSEQGKENLRKEVWATFPRQNEAMNFAKEHNNVRIFSYQDHLLGQRRFLVSTYHEFWKRYRNMDSKFRHHYEVIQEGLPCHLYFDLEFSTKDNVGKNGDEMVDLLISVVFDALNDNYSIEGSEDWVVELDSSTTEKFSRHLIIRIPKAAFKDNSHVGSFVSEVCSRISALKAKDERYSTLYIRKDSNSTEHPSHLFIDTAVYTRNRCFRLALSSKAGKSSFLLPTQRFKCISMEEEDMFMASLICNVDSDTDRLLVCKMDLECIKKLHFDTEVNYSVTTKYREPSNNGTSSRGPPITSSTEGKSPFPALDRFVECIASTGNTSGKIRSWYWFSEDGLMVYSMLRNRYCERIGREHKSNHVIYVVDLKWGFYYQKCHDPDCQGYKSPFRPVPIDMIPNHSPEPPTSFDRPNEYQLVNSNAEGGGSGGKDSWWIEAMKAADDIEREKSGSGLLAQMDESEEDEMWWLAVERSLSQVPIPQHAVHHQSILREPIPAPNFPYTVKKKSLAKTSWKPENIQNT
ncbi:DNA-directed primase/polymerase protein [Linum perenne]